MKTICGIVVILLLVLACVTSSISHASQTDNAMAEEWWINVPSSPLRIARIASGRLVILSNYSFGSVTQYQLGCAIIEPGKVRVKSKMKAQKTNLQPADWDKSKLSFQSLDSREKYKERCETENAKLAVIKVTFDDGSVWKAVD